MQMFLDIGTQAGWALHMSSGMKVSGTFNCKPSKHENWAARFVAFKEMLKDFTSIEDISEIYYEEVRAHKGVDAAHAYGGFLAMLNEMAEADGVALTGVPVQTIKKHATGKGNASKADMIEAAYQNYGVDVSDDNEADAVCLRELILDGWKK